MEAEAAVWLCCNSNSSSSNNITCSSILAWLQALRCSNLHRHKAAAAAGWLRTTNRTSLCCRRRRRCRHRHPRHLHSRSTMTRLPSATSAPSQPVERICCKRYRAPISSLPPYNQLPLPALRTATATARSVPRVPRPTPLPTVPCISLNPQQRSSSSTRNSNTRCTCSSSNNSTNIIITTTTSNNNSLSISNRCLAARRHRPSLTLLLLQLRRPRHRSPRAPTASSSSRTFTVSSSTRRRRASMLHCSLPRRASRACPKRSTTASISKSPISPSARTAFARRSSTTPWSTSNNPPLCKAGWNTQRWRRSVVILTDVAYVTLLIEALSHSLECSRLTFRCFFQHNTANSQQGLDPLSTKRILDDQVSQTRRASSKS